MEINQLGYGNPNREFMEFLSKKTPYDGIFELTKGYKPPKNDSEITKYELNTIAESIDEVDEDNLKRFKMIDSNIVKYYSLFLKSKGIEGEKLEPLLREIIDEALPLIAKIKMHYNRPRPYQLAQIFKLKLFPYHTINADSPAYPSGHVIQACLLSEVLSARYPTMSDEFSALIDVIGSSRIMLGVHYPSDNDLALFVGEMIINDEWFQSKHMERFANPNAV
jgi:chorismate mutase